MNGCLVTLPNTLCSHSSCFVEVLDPNFRERPATLQNFQLLASVLAFLDKLGAALCTALVSFPLGCATHLLDNVLYGAQEFVQLYPFIFTHAALSGLMAFAPAEETQRMLSSMPLTPGIFHCRSDFVFLLHLTWSASIYRPFKLLINHRRLPLKVDRCFSKYLHPVRPAPWSGMMYRHTRFLVTSLRRAIRCTRTSGTLVILGCSLYSVPSR